MKPRMLLVTHRLTGPEHLVINVLNAAHARGHLLDHHTPERLDHNRVAITITLLQPADAPGPAPARRGRGRVRRGLRFAVTVLAGVAGVAVVAAVGWGVWLLLPWIHAHPWPLILGVVVATILAAAASITMRRRGADGRGWGSR